MQTKLVTQRKVPLAEKLSKLAAMSQLSLHTIVNCEYLIESFKRDGTPMPESATTVKEHILKFCHDVKRKVLLKLKSSKYISICCDEWTSCANTRYLNVFAHTEAESFNLGLIQIKGSASAPNIHYLTMKKLDEFEIDECKVISFCTDGAATMIAVGRTMEPVHTICFLYTLHLAVCDSIYGPCLDDKGVYEDDDVDEDAYNDFTEPSHGTFSIKEKFKQTILNVRKLVKYFISSPKRSEVLANYAKEQENVKASKLILDCKTRWSSMVLMLKRFCDLLPSIRMALISTKSEYDFSNSDEKLLISLIDALNPFEEAVLYMSKDRANLFDAICTTNFLKKSLESQSSEISKELLQNFTRRVESRVDKELGDFCTVIVNP